LKLGRSLVHYDLSPFTSERSSLHVAEVFDRRLLLKVSVNTVYLFVRLFVERFHVSRVNIYYVNG